MSNQTPVYLLDKSVARKIVTGIAKVEAGKRLSYAEDNALTLLWEMQNKALRPFITPETFNLLQRFAGQAGVDLFLEMVEVMRASRYFRRWARRLHEYDFTYEDAKVLSLGTFGTRQEGDILGADSIVTLDQPFINNYQVRFDALQERLGAMTVNLPLPFCKAVLPTLLRPAEVITILK